MSTYATPIPGAAIYAQIEELANKAYANTLAELNQKRTSLLQQYGYLGSVDKRQGVVTKIHVDPYNPYGQLQTMLRNQAQEDQQAQWANEDRGLVGGLANQAYSNLHYTHGGQSAQLGQTFNNTLSDYQYQQQQAAYARDMALYQAELAQAQAAIGAQAFDPGTSAGPYTPPPQGGAPLPGSTSGFPNMAQVIYHATNPMSVNPSNLGSALAGARAAVPTPYLIHGV